MSWEGVGWSCPPLRTPVWDGDVVWRGGGWWGVGAVGLGRVVGVLGEHWGCQQGPVQLSALVLVGTPLLGVARSGGDPALPPASS